MTLIAGIGFTAPWLLLALLTLPIIWLLLRAIPPAPRRQIFPAITLLLGLKDEDSQSDRTPWWLLLLRLAAVAAAIIGLAGPILNPDREEAGSGPLLFVLDASWAGAAEWEKTREQIAARLDQAGRAERPVALLRLTEPRALTFQAASNWQQRLPGTLPQPWQPGPDQITQSLERLAEMEGAFDTLWFGDGLAYDGQKELAEALAARGEVTVIQSGLPVYGLRPVELAEGALQLTLLRSRATAEETQLIQVRGSDPNGQDTVLASLQASFATGETQTQSRFTLPAELTARITRFELPRQASAGAVALSDDSLRRREVALVGAGSEDEGLALLSQLHYLRQALAPSADLLEGRLSDLLPANPDVVVLADIARLAPDQEEDLANWVEAGGLLLRFAGPRLAASDTARSQEERLMPVRLRIGGRSIGGALSWGEPKTLAPFPENSPFQGLTIPQEVSVTSQVVAQPDPSLASRVIAALEDGTPLVTRKELGAGQVVLFHVTANAEWSSLPLSGLFVQMLERLSVSSATSQPDAESLEGTTWQASTVLDGFGRLRSAETLPGVAGPDLVANATGPQLPPGLYQSAGRSLARNVLRPEDELHPAQWGSGLRLTGYEVQPEQPLGGVLLALALVLLSLDVLATLLLSGQLRQRSSLAALALLVLPLAAMTLAAHPAKAQSQLPIEGAGDAAIEDHIGRAAELTLAHVITGDSQLDRVALAGLQGLSDTLFFRTSVEPANPVSVDLERDELAFYPLLYWPISTTQALPSSEAYKKLNAYLHSGGMILFDTRDADLAARGGTSQAARKLQQLALPLDIPPLEPLPSDHVLTRTFYLLKDFPGRHPRGALWVEAAPADAEQAEGIPFRDLNDGVTPVVIGGNDWAAAWAVDRNGRPLLPVGRGYSGERQRELAFRFGVNLVMHVLTGNYKSDQVHVPALLERLGQ
ncbi:hypothetical protein RSK20926_07512 [Roseobacter sp. SK209-2-6]|uniref:DUF4159 domain-containing protein n=1 Tax=Roseobacter sp. SK209-2-6 TaxID=388739 RepID=UPI0000F3D704|nr:DUF4159 domain-containing protein [Roseobacter sp. SK209-2-6]EBA17567.1 hypothetical protein RSK20926_07512 [Roseobacter sp. SK209-2-6]